MAATSRTIRHQDSKPDQLWVSLILSGSARFGQSDRSTIDQAGDLSIRDTNVPWEIEYGGPIDLLAVELPRQRIERLLGSARHFAGLTVNGNLPTTTLARSFLCDLLRVGDQMRPEVAERMTSVGIDLVVASIAERMAMDTPKSLQGTLTVQRAKAFIESNLGDTSLDPPQVSTAIGISLRHLHALFRERGRTVAAWIWERRLEMAAQRLSDPAYASLPLGALAYGCGFTNQSHFSRRFSERYGVNPRDYRHAALTAAAARQARR